MIKSLSFILTILFTLSMSAQSQLIDKVVAKVGSEYILLSEIEEEFSYAKSRNPNVSSSIKCDILDNIIAQKLVIYHAKIISENYPDTKYWQPTLGGFTNDAKTLVTKLSTGRTRADRFEWL